MKIKLLDPNVSNKIAAGEVVERPSSIVKELCENSIDAGASSITVEIKGGGIDYIRITDNGCGMEQDDVKTAFLRHATSKISVAEDLNNILTLGFRGEALASIASVSQIVLQTRTKNSIEGTEINLSGGTIEKFTSCGCPEGTLIRVENLFFNTPARRKFLKRPSQEASYINDVINRLALSHPEVAVKFISEGKTVLRTPGDGLLSSCIRGIYGADVAANIIPLEFSDRGITLSGFLGNREIQKSNRSWQILFINGRSVKNDLVSAAVYQGYAGRLNVGKFPFFVLSISLEGNLVDVNVHPTKQEVRFADGLPIFDTVLTAVSRTLTKNQEIPSLFKQERVQPVADVKVISGVPGAKETNVSPSQTAEQKPTAQNIPAGQNTPAEPQKAKIDPYEPISPQELVKSLNEQDKYRFDSKKPFAVETGFKGYSSQKPTPVYAEKNKEVHALADYLKDSVKGMNDSSDAVSVKISPVQPAEKDDFKNLIEKTDFREQKTQQNVREQGVQTAENVQEQSIQNASAVSEQTTFISEEKLREFEPDYKIIGILFDTYIVIEFEGSAYIIDQHAAHERILFERLYASCGENSASQILMIPRIIKVSPSEQAILEDLIPHLTELGYEIDDVGLGSFAVKATPSALEDTDPEKFITSLLTEGNSIKILRTNELKRNKLMQLACKSAVKAGDKLTENDIKVLLDLIVKESVPLSCPHGRPILIKLSKHELEVRFKRIQ